LPYANDTPIGEDSLPSGSDVLDTTPVGAIMQRRVISCAQNSKVEEIVQVLGARRVHALVVVDDQGVPVGVVSRTDLLLARQGRSPETARGLRAAQVMTKGLITCTPDTPLDAAVTLMTKNHLHRLVVMDRDREARGPTKMVGILSMSDVIEATLGLRED